MKISCLSLGLDPAQVSDVLVEIYQMGAGAKFFSVDPGQMSICINGKHFSRFIGLINRVSIEKYRAYIYYGISNVYQIMASSDCLYHSCVTKG